MNKFTPKNPFKFLFAFSYAVMNVTDNRTRMELWRIRWKEQTGNEPAKWWTVAFCRTCNKPHWYPHAKHRHITASCPGH